MDEYESLSHTTWDCKYHVVFIPKCRRRTLYQELRRHLGEVFRRLALQKESKVEEGHLMPDHVHMLLSIPPIGGHYLVDMLAGGAVALGAIAVQRSIAWADCFTKGAPTPGALTAVSHHDVPSAVPEDIA